MSFKTKSDATPTLAVMMESECGQLNRRDAMDAERNEELPNQIRSRKGEWFPTEPKLNLLWTATVQIARGWRGVFSPRLSRLGGSISCGSPRCDNSPFNYSEGPRDTWKTVEVKKIGVRIFLTQFF